MPADSITASVPQVGLAPDAERDDGKGAGAAAPSADGGSPGPTHWSSIPPVPKVALARPGRVQPWPTREACWSPAMPQMGGAPGSAVAAPTAPDESTTAGIIGKGICKLLRADGSSQAIAGSTSAVTAALVASVTCSASRPAAAPPERVQATQLSTVPKQSSPPLGPGSFAGRPRRGWP